MIVERIINPWTHPFQKTPASLVTYPEIVEQQILRNLGAASEQTQNAILNRIRLHDFTKKEPWDSCRQHAEVPMTTLSEYDLKTWVPFQYSIDTPRTKGPVGGWRMPAVDLARILACLDAAGHVGVTLLSKAARDLMWSEVPHERAAGTKVRATSGGWFQGWFSPGHRYLWHNGVFNGGTTLLMYDPELRLGFALAYNQKWTTMVNPSSTRVSEALDDIDGQELLDLLHNTNLPDAIGDPDLFEAVGYRPLI